MNKKAVTAIGAAAFIAAFAVMTVGFFTDTSLKASLGLAIAERALLALAALCGIFLAGCKLRLKPRGGYIPFAAALIITLANFPLECLIRGSLVIKGDAFDIVLYVLSCVATGVFEELLFRALLFFIVLDVTKKRRFGDVEAVLITNAAFGLMHLINLFAGASVGATFLQVGYSFLIGCMLSAVYACSESILLPIVLHVVFNLGGTLTASGVASGSQWDTVSIIIMAVVSVAAGLVVLYCYFSRRPHFFIREENPPAP